MSKTQGASLELVGLSKKYHDVVAVSTLDLEIKRGEFITFLGPSGSGKTTTLKMIAGLEVPSNGDIRLDRKSIVRVPVHKRDIGMVFQNYALFPHMTVFRNIAFPLEMRRKNKADVAKAVTRVLDMVNLSGYERRRPTELSGGQQQRVALARALVFEPLVLLLDEPLGALDAKLRETMKSELKELHTTIGTTIIFVTHDQQEALTLSDRVALFNRGNLAQVGTPRELYQTPAKQFVADFIGETNFFSGSVIHNTTLSVRVQVDEQVVVNAPPRNGLTHRSRVTYAVRPEKMLIEPTGSGHSNRLRGTITESFYLGDAYKYRVSVSPSLSLLVKVPEGNGSIRMDVGAAVTVAWDIGDMTVIAGP